MRLWGLVLLLALGCGTPPAETPRPSPVPVGVALEEARAAVEASPRDAAARVRLAEALEREGDFAGSAREWLEAARRDPRNPMWQFRSVDALVQVDPAEAERMARRLVRRMPGTAGSHERLARALMGRYLREADPALLEAAASAAERALALERTSDTLLLQAQMAYLQGREPEAAAGAKAALEAGLSEENAIEARNWLGWMAFRRGDVREASRWYHSALDAIAASGDGSHAAIQPRWETYAFYLVVFCGERIPMAEFRRFEPVYRELAARGMIDQPLYRFSREYLYNVLEAWYAGDYRKGLHVTREFMATPDPEERTEVRPRGFFSEAVEEPSEKLLMPLVYAELYRGAGETERARYHYRRALRMLPGNPVLGARMEDL